MKNNILYNIIQKKYHIHYVECEYMVNLCVYIYYMYLYKRIRFISRKQKKYIMFTITRDPKG